ncbi:helix-turn-helix domain-containing protein [Natronococcus sp. A-GB1]|uniref:helix-turn-helix domain-containing protein n=1 Tax=Natronococcus sp. A-GB1 TaxID=3037648 RepID=UPI00241E4966|nr:helix-turn-helix domain-containing protein [Natronococcus sp. A-GB1]MDG5761570.1 helix-turn-helix domain-containing protein [Natronococcus sp. A-GB1]
MSFIAEFTLAATVERVPTVGVHVEDEQPREEGPSRLILWARGTDTDLKTFFRQLEDDPSVADVEQLSGLPEKRLFRISLSATGERGLTYTDAIELGITFLRIEFTDAGTRYRAQVPSRKALSAYHARCDERSLSFVLRRLYESDDETQTYDLTTRQREVLRAATEAGYFEVPREISTAELAAQFDVSSQALSALIRRGEQRLLRTTVASDLP